MERLRAEAPVGPPYLPAPAHFLYSGPWVPCRALGGAYSTAPLPPLRVPCKAPGELTAQHPLPVLRVPCKPTPLHPVLREALLGAVS